MPHRSSWTGLKGGGPISEMQHVIPDPSTANFPPKKSGIESTDTGKDDLKKKKTVGIELVAMVKKGPFRSMIYRQDIKKW